MICSLLTAALLETKVDALDRYDSLTGKTCYEVNLHDSRINPHRPDVLGNDINYLVPWDLAIFVLFPLVLSHPGILFISMCTYLSAITSILRPMQWSVLWGSKGKHITELCLLLACHHKLATDDCFWQVIYWPWRTRQGLPRQTRHRVSSLPRSKEIWIS